jgi:hypothetical protein
MRKLTISEKVLQIVKLAKITWYEIYKLDESNKKLRDQLEAEYQDKVKDIINS